MRPAIIRNSELLPAPFGPVRRSALRAAIEKLMARNTRRPPRTQPKSQPKSFIATISYILAPAAAPTVPSQTGRAIAYNAALFLVPSASWGRVGGGSEQHGAPRHAPPPRPSPVRNPTLRSRTCGGEGGFGHVIKGSKSATADFARGEGKETAAPHAVALLPI